MHRSAVPVEDATPEHKSPAKALRGKYPTYATCWASLMQSSSTARRGQAGAASPPCDLGASRDAGSNATPALDADLLVVLAPGDLDLAGLSLFRDRNLQGQDTGGVVGAELVRVQGVA